LRLRPRGRRESTNIAAELLGLFGDYWVGHLKQVSRCPACPRFPLSQIFRKNPIDPICSIVKLFLTFILFTLFSNIT
jgi:hypothetical protein